MSCAVDLHRELTVEEIAALSGDPLRRVQERVSLWFARQIVDAAIPRVRRARGPLGGHPRYYVDAPGYHAWRQATAVRELPPVGVRGCSCVRMVLENGTAGAFVSADCVVHGSLL